MDRNFHIREAKPSEYSMLGQLIADVYSSLDGFPKRSDNPDYYATFSELEKLAAQKDTKILVASDTQQNLLGGLVFYGQAVNYGSGVINTDFPDTSGIRLLAVHPEARKKGIAKALTLECIERTKKLGHSKLILHTTASMQIAWSMYERMGFVRWEALGFELNGLDIFGFKMRLQIEVR